MLGLLTPESLIDGFLVGLICGIIPLYFSTGKNRLGLGFGAVLACIVSGLLLGLPLAILVAGVFLWLLFRQSEPVLPEVQARKRQLVITVLAVMGIFVAGYLTWSHYSNEPVYCGGSNSCELVNSSRFAYLGPIPVALIGVTGYFIILGLSLIPQKEERQWPMLLIFGGALIGVMLQWYLFGIEVFVLRAICYWCVTSQAVITLIFLLSIPRRVADVEEAEADRVEA
ncbi:Vitamin K epoxide reductase [Thermoflexales bacterium]|nr:Vitamin K epoxide reductase [Thermoflexales bacterium]